MRRPEGCGVIATDVSIGANEMATALLVDRGDTISSLCTLIGTNEDSLTSLRVSGPVNEDQSYLLFDDGPAKSSDNPRLSSSRHARLPEDQTLPARRFNSKSKSAREKETASIFLSFCLFFLFC